MYQYGGSKTLAQSSDQCVKCFVRFLTIEGNNISQVTHSSQFVTIKFVGSSESLLNLNACFIQRHEIFFVEY